MARIILSILLLVEIGALANRGGGPLLSHLLLTAATFVAVCLCLWKKVRLKDAARWPLLSYGAFFLFFVLSLLISLTPQYGLAGFLLFFNTGILLFILAGFPFSEKDITQFSVGLIAVATVETLIGFFFYTQTAFPRFTGTFIDLAKPYTSFGNDHANFLLLILPLAIGQLFSKHRRVTTPLVAGFATALLLAGFVLSFSRAAWLSFLVVILVAAGFFVLHKTARKNFVSAKEIALRGGATLIMTIILISGLQVVRSQKFPTISLLHKAAFKADEGGASITERFDFWKGAVQIIADRPLFGGGVLSFKYLYPKYQEKFGANWDHPHNLFLKIGVENGIFSMALFALFLLAAGITWGRFLWKNPSHPLLFFLFGSLGAFGHNLLDYNFIVANFTLFIAFIGLGLSFAGGAKPQNDSRVALRFALIFSLTVMLLGLHEGIYNASFKRGRALFEAEKFDEAVKYLEKSQKLFFERDLSHYLSAVYKKKYEQTHDSVWRLKERKLLTRIIDGATVDAFPYARLGELAIEDKEFTQAENLFSKALELDPKNRLQYHYWQLNAARRQGKRLSPLVRGKTVKLLEEYVGVLKKNQHMTILTDNPFHASKLYDFFYMKKEREELDKIWFEELVKFSVKYGGVPKPVL